MHHRSGYSVCGFVILVATAVTGHAEIRSPQTDYLDGKRALQAREFPLFQRHLDRLANHPLYAFLEYEFLKDRLAKTSDLVVTGFLRRHPDAVVTRLLREQWLRQLAKRQQWDVFLEAYRPLGNDEIECHRLNALLGGGQAVTGFDAQIERLWMTGASRPDACDPVFAAWHAAGKLNAERVWARIKLALTKSQLGLVRHLSRTYLNDAGQREAKHWIALHNAPAAELLRPALPDTNWIIHHALSRLADRDIDQAAAIWAKLESQPRFDEADRGRAYRTLGLAAAYEHDPRALPWLRRASATGDDATLRQWRVRAALRSRRWDAVLDFLDGLTAEEQLDPKWRYWRARALEANADRDGAQQLYQSLAATRHYYGFLAADTLKVPYAMQHTPLQVAAAAVDTAAKHNGLAMAFALHAAGDKRMGRRQWEWATRNFDKQSLRAAAVLAVQRGWHDRSIVSAGRGDYLNDLELRFPTRHYELIHSNAHRQGIDPSWVYGVVRQESAFMVDARSSVGALGLMQLMPATGRRVARELNIKISGETSILQIDNNIRLGTAYLRTILGGHDGNSVLATAAYNAGPHRIREWLPKQDDLPADIWIETIPFKETRNFVKNVLAFAVVYDYRLGTTQQRLQQRMPDVTASQRGT
ncbi:MAG: transglycosylase SLT domain-containing protein [Gammaproteobacteria bacterium]|nr:transglycosylase SLT domain-containing protein [Gammaproteobacteria bacterium]